MSGSHFGPELFAFLSDLAANNDRDWFHNNKERYENHVRHPALQFITDFGPHLRKISPHFLADPRKGGGSLFRIHRDVRFSKDKSPYKTHTGLHFRHEHGKSAHAPGFYLHLQPGQVFAGAGIWHPDGPTLIKIRTAIVENSTRWKRVIGGKTFRQHVTMAGDTLLRPPRGFDSDHPLIDDIKRKDFFCLAELTEKNAVSPGFLQEYAGVCRAGVPLIRFLCEATGAPF